MPSKIKVYPVALGRNTDGLLTPFNTLGCLVAYAKVHDGGRLSQEFEFGGIRPLGPRADWLVNEIGNGDPAVVLLSSYVWNHDMNLEFARAVRAASPESLLLIGGPHIPRLPGKDTAFLDAHPELDVAVRNEGELTFVDLLTTLASSSRGPSAMRRTDFTEVAGITCRDSAGKPFHTPDRPRLRDLSILPSPFLTGEFDAWFEGAAFMPVETNRGCPYGCTFCDWGAATLSKVFMMSDERVFGEIEFAAKRHVAFYAFCDANFGIMQRDVAIAKHVIEMNRRTGFPRETGFTSAKVATPRLLEIAKTLHQSGLLRVMQSALQTTDARVLEIVKRSNIRTNEYDKMISFYRKEGIPVGADLMVGLPGQTIESTAKDLQYLFDRRLNGVFYSTSVMPNAPMASEAYREEFGIKVDDEGFVSETFSFGPDEYARIFDLFLAYKFFVKVGVAKYLLYFMQIERGVPALDLVKRWAQTRFSPEPYPISHRIWKELMARDYSRKGIKDWLVLHWSHDEAKFLFDDIGAFYDELLRMYREEFGARTDGSDLEAVLEAQAAVMPGRDAAAAPIKVRHDVAAYFAAMRNVGALTPGAPEVRRLSEYPSGRVELESASRERAYRLIDMNTLSADFELRSNVSL